MPISKDVKIAKGVKIPYPKLVNLYGCKLKSGVFVGPFVEIQKGAVVGKNSRISSHTFICEGVEVGENVFVAHGVTFINDLFSDNKGRDWNLRKTEIGNNVKIGSNSTILPVKIGENSIIGAGSVVSKNVPKNTIVCGNPAKKIKSLKK